MSKKDDPQPIVDMVNDPTSLRHGWWRARCPLCDEVAYELRNKLRAHKRIDGHIMGKHLAWPRRIERYGPDGHREPRSSKHSDPA